MTSKPLVIIESPLAGDFCENLRYALWCARESALRGEAPFASHLIYPLFLDDEEPSEREVGMTSGFAYAEQAEMRAFYLDRGVSAGMERGLMHAQANGQKCVDRLLSRHAPDIWAAFNRGEWPPCTKAFQLMAASCPVQKQ